MDAPEATFDRVLYKTRLHWIVRFVGPVLLAVGLNPYAYLSMWRSGQRITLFLVGTIAIALLVLFVKAVFTKTIFYENSIEHRVFWRTRRHSYREVDSIEPIQGTLKIRFSDDSKIVIQDIAGSADEVANLIEERLLSLQGNETPDQHS